MEQKENRILLHACCGICSGYPISLLQEIGYVPVVYFCNPNLDSREEFEKRLVAQKKICEYFNVELIVEEYNHNEYLEFIKGLEQEPEKGFRCDKCIELRLKKTYQKALDIGIQMFTTSLTVSPHKNFLKIKTIGENLSTTYQAFDFKKKDGFFKTNKLSKDLELYRQYYCGCEFSKN